jgi:hypothetical protein
MNLFDKNRNDLSKYSYDLSKATIISMIIIPFVQGKIPSSVLAAGAIVSIILLVLGMMLKEGKNVDSVFVPWGYRNSRHHCCPYL